ncbi:MAG: hypothetical protein JW862_01455 [Anaerolineales bacterium]|nr:hypothetical protein [Anaerolineales bacterium]
MPPKQQTYVKFSDKLTDSLVDITRMIDDHKGMIDTIQEVAIELTSTMATLNTLTVKYASKANEILDVLLPIMEKVPFLPEKLKELLTQMEKWTQKIIDNDESTTKTIADVQSGLKSGDVKKIQAHSNELKKISQRLTSILPQND